MAVVLTHAGSHCNTGWDVARGHSQTWEFGSTPRFPYKVRALLSEGQKLSNWQQEALRQEVWSGAEWGVWVQTLPCPSCSSLAATKGHGEQWTLYPISKSKHEIIIQCLWVLYTPQEYRGKWQGWSKRWNSFHTTGKQIRNLQPRKKTTGVKGREQGDLWNLEHPVADEQGVTSLLTQDLEEIRQN